MAVECKDKNCFVHGTLRLRGQIILGKVIGAKTRGTVIIERPTIKYISKYKRYAKTRSRMPAHNPPCIGAKEGDIVKVAECRRISRTKSWCVCEIVKKEGE